VHEIVTGPLNAGLFPNRAYDATLGAESLFLYGPDAPVTDWAQAKPWMNYGVVSVNRVDGEAVYTLELDPR
jgi:hypothetical protein